MSTKPFWKVTVTMRFKKTANDLAGTATGTLEEEEAFTNKIMDRIEGLLEVGLGESDVFGWEFEKIPDHLSSNRYLAEVKS